MSKERIERRKFLQRASALGATAAAFSFEEQALLAYQAPPEGRGGPPRMRRPAGPSAAAAAGPMPVGKLGDVEISRLIAGHNLVGFQAHAGEILYASQLLRAYFTDDKILETWEKIRDAGINTSLLRISDEMVALAKRFNEERGGGIQWLAQIVINERDHQHDFDVAMEVGTKAAYIRGLEGDRFWNMQRMDVLASGLEYGKSLNIPVGLASHSLDALMGAEKVGLDADFYMKTFNSGQYSSLHPVDADPNWKPTETQLVQSEFGTDQRDNLWEVTPKQTTEFFAKLDKPFVAYKVLGAGRIFPSDGFRWAFENGADFVAVGMYDFQVADDAGFTKEVLAGDLKRTRPWRA